MNSKKHTIAMILAAVLALSLLLTACGKSGDTPTGDNTTPGTSSTPVETDKGDDNTLDGGDETPDNGDGTDKPSYTTANISGNTSANLSNRGLAAIQGDWIYFVSNDGNDADPVRETSEHVRGCLYAVKTDGSGLRKLADDRVSNINVVGDWIYYYNKSESENLYKIKIDGTERQAVGSYAKNLYVIGDRVSFTNFGIYSANLPNIGSSANQILDMDSQTQGWIESMSVSGDWIYYTTYKDRRMYKIKTDGTGNQKLTDDDCVDIQVVGDYIYYKCGYLYVMKTDGTDKRMVTDDGGLSEYNATGDFIYFTKSNDDYNLYSMKPDGSEVKKISDDRLEKMNLIDGWIYFIDRADLKIYKMKTDGTERQLLD